MPSCINMLRGTLEAIRNCSKELGQVNFDAYVRSNMDAKGGGKMKDPMDRPMERGEKTGPCPNCGYPVVVARKSRQTGELYFGCARPKRGRYKGCNFKGCRSH